MSEPSDHTTNEREYTLDELSTAAGVTPRTVRYYIAEGLLPPAVSVGRNSSYGQEHMDKLLAIGTLKEMYLPLKEIRRRLNTLTLEQLRDPAQLAAQVAPSAPEPRFSTQSALAAEPEDSAADYLQRHAPRSPQPMRAPAPAPAIAPRRSVDTWERFPVTRDAEILIRSDRVERMGANLRQILFEIGQLIENGDHHERNRR